jgi:two-component system nitrogen regulation response regulator GlnG
MPLETQTRLLRVLQKGEYRSPSGHAAARADLRIVAATNRDLYHLIQHGLFREDLFYRLNVVPLRMPPLREREEDIPDLAQHFLRKARAQGLPRKDITPAALEHLKRYDWPGNVRELENFLRRLCVLAVGQVIEEEIVASAFAEIRSRAAASEKQTISKAVEYCLRSEWDMGKRAERGLFQRVLHEVERPLIEFALEIANGNQIRAAETLGVNRNTLRKKMRELGIRVERDTRLN